MHTCIAPCQVTVQPSTCSCQHPPCLSLVLTFRTCRSCWRLRHLSACMPKSAQLGKTRQTAGRCLTGCCQGERATTVCRAPAHTVVSRSLTDVLAYTAKGFVQPQCGHLHRCDAKTCCWCCCWCCCRLSPPKCFKVVLECKNNDYITKD